MRAVVRHACVTSALRHVRNDSSGSSSSSNGATECAALCSSRRPLVTHDGALRDVFRLPPPRVQSPLTPLRPPPPPSARDVLPFGSLNKTHRPRYYYNVNVVAATAPTTESAHHHHRNNGSNNNNSGSCSVGGEATTAVTATPMDVARLTRNNNDRGRAATVAANNTDNNTNKNKSSSRVLLAQNTPHVQQQQQQRRLRVHTTHDTAATTPSHTHTTLTDGRSVHGAAAAAASQHPRKEQQQQQQQQHRQTYEEHCIVGWSLSDFYRVVADVDSYSAFLPWCASSRVHTRRCVQANGAGSDKDDDDDDAAAAARVEEMTATLTVGFSWLTESYTSRVTLVPGESIVAVLHDERHGGSSDDDEKETNNNSSSSSSGGGGGLLTSLLRKAVHTASAVARNSILQELCCEWRFAAQPDKPHEVEVRFAVSFTFSNPLYSRLIMSNIVAIMIRSFERRCEALYGPPSTPHRTLPAST